MMLVVLPIVVLLSCCLQAASVRANPLESLELPVSYCPSPNPKQPEKCGEHLHFHGDRKSWRSAPGEFPYLADIEIKLQGENEFHLANCSGAILSKRHILTSIKCVRNNKSDELLDKDSELKVFVGSLFQGKYGQEVKVEEILQLDMATEKAMCRFSKKVHHGLALLKLVKPIKFQFEKHNASAPIQRRKFINSACFTGAKNEPQRTFNLSSYVAGGICQEAFQFEMAVCPGGDENMEEDRKYDCATLREGPKELTNAIYQEGAPLVEMTSEDRRWQVVGILSRDVSIFGDCELPQVDDTTLAKFIPLYDESVQKWLKREVLNKNP